LPDMIFIAGGPRWRESVAAGLAQGTRDATLRAGDVPDVVVRGVLLTAQSGRIGGGALGSGRATIGR